MKPLVRHIASITATAGVTTALLVALLASPTATAQPAPAPDPAAAAPKDGSAAPGTTVTGTDSTPPVTTPDASGSAAAGAAAGAAEKQEEKKKEAPPTITAVPCEAAKVTLVVKAGQGGFDLQCASTKADECSLRGAIAAGTAVRFELGGDAIQPFPEDKTRDIQLVRAPAGQTTCLRFDAPGKFRFRAASQPVEGTVVVKMWYELLADRPIDEEGNYWMPKAVNQEADPTDTMFYAVLGLSAFFFFAILIAVVYLTWKYRHRPGHKAEPSAAHNDALEITWTVIPTIICVFLFYFGWRTYVNVVTPPNKAVEVNVLAWRWSWQFTHANGVKDKDLHVPVGTPVRLVMTSKDVLHSFYAPVMRVKQDIIPRRYTYAWFQATKPGTYRLACAEYCGTDHSQMGINPEDGRRAVVVVHEPGKYEQYLADEYARSNDMPSEQLGAKVYEKNCTSCHSIDGSARVGPTFKGAFGKPVPLVGGKSVPFDEDYARRSILNPNADTHQGYPAGTMPSFEGQLKEKEIQGLIDYMKSLK